MLTAIPENGLEEPLTVTAKFMIVSLTLVIAVEAEVVPIPVAVIVPVYVPAITPAKSALLLSFYAAGQSRT